MHDNFLVEIHTEELPPKSLLNLAENFETKIAAGLKKADLHFTHSRFFATPRRLAVFVENLVASQSDKYIERKGPSLQNAFDKEGNPTPACEGFAKSCDVSTGELITLETPHGKFVGYKQHVAGKKVSDVVPLIIQEALAALPVAKPMRWGKHSYKFIRPVHSVLMLYGSAVIETTLLGCQSGNKTRGHRFMHPKWIEIPHANDYVNALKSAFVLVDFNERKNRIVSDSHNLMSEKFNNTTKALIHPDLLNEVTSLVEWPEVICGSFNSEFLTVPSEALIASMQDHQRYFPIVDNHNQLLPYFITVSNIVSKEANRIVEGNERVLRARLSDAKFFFDSDKKFPLENHVEQLKSVVFQQKLGSLFDKTQRLQKLAQFIAAKIHFDTTLADRAAFLSKADLLTALVGEFPELQGTAGRAYAEAHESSEVAIALEEQYMPCFSGDKLPSTPLGSILALTDRIDTLVGIFGINQSPTGDKDPFGLRRAAIGILRILIEKPFDLDLKKLLIHSFETYAIPLENKNVVQETLSFIIDRLKPWYQEKNIPTNVISSVLSLNLTRPYDIDCRIQAVMKFKDLPEAEALSAANKRVSNILAKYNDKLENDTINTALFESNEERELAKKLSEQAEKISQFSATSNYQEILSQLSELRAPIDNFFDHVMVMTDDKAQRENRLLLLKKLRDLFLHVADIALLS